jgi:NodT family efflux transporter outer membrane factor (OMF) lipoprotein
MTEVRFAVLVLAGLAACRAATPSSTPEPVVPASWSTGSGAADSADPPERWWQAFGDPTLDALVERAVSSSLDLALARSRVLEARGLRDFTAGGRQPEITGRASVTRSQASANTRQGSVTGADARNLFDVGFDAGWEVDLFGATRLALEAAEAGVRVAEEDRRDVIVTLLAEVARNYAEMRGLERRRAITLSNAEAQRESLALTRVRFEAGLATALDVARARTLLATTQAQIPVLEAGIAGGHHRLCVLLGLPPGSLEAALAPDPAVEARVPQVGTALTNLAAGLPADLLRRRPDIRRAEQELARASALSAAAVADLYPKLTLGASLGWQSLHSGDWLDQGSRTWSIGPSLFAPLFAGGRLRAAVRVQDARQEQAILRYQKTILDAFGEVEISLVDVAREGERRVSLAEALESSRRSLDLAGELHRRGLADFFEVLEAQRSHLALEAELAESDTALATGAIGLYKALGGGWESLDVAASRSAAAPDTAEPDPVPAGPGSPRNTL